MPGVPVDKLRHTPGTSRGHHVVIPGAYLWACLGDKPG